MALITRGSISVWGWGGGGLVHVQHDPGPFFWYQNNFIFWCYFQNCLLIIIIILCAGILTRKKISIAHTSSESCYQEGKKAFRSLSQYLIHQPEQDQTAAKHSNTMLCNPFIQLNTETDTQGMHMTINNIPNNFIAHACWLCCIKMAGYWPSSLFQIFRRPLDSSARCCGIDSQK